MVFFRQNVHYAWAGIIYRTSVSPHLLNIAEVLINLHWLLLFLEYQFVNEDPFIPVDHLLHFKVIFPKLSHLLLSFLFILVLSSKFLFQCIYRLFQIFHFRLIPFLIFFHFQFDFNYVCMVYQLGLQLFHGFFSLTKFYYDPSHLGTEPCLQIFLKFVVQRFHELLQYVLDIC